MDKLPHKLIKCTADKAREIIECLDIDEIVDSVVVMNKIKPLIERLCMDHWQELSDLLFDFFNHKSDANIWLMAEEQDNFLDAYKEYLSNRYKL